MVGHRKSKFPGVSTVPGAVSPGFEYVHVMIDDYSGGDERQRLRL
jgi:hypothetical protein